MFAINKSNVIRAEWFRKDGNNVVEYTVHVSEVKYVAGALGKFGLVIRKNDLMSFHLMQSFPEINWNKAGTK